MDKTSPTPPCDSSFYKDDSPFRRQPWPPAQTTHGNLYWCAGGPKTETPLIPYRLCPFKRKPPWVA